jgi:hypothetical protein
VFSPGSLARKGIEKMKNGFGGQNFRGTDVFDRNPFSRLFSHFKLSNLFFISQSSVMMPFDSKSLCRLS